MQPKRRELVEFVALLQVYVGNGRKKKGRFCHELIVFLGKKRSKKS
jgi:hypothetical protein